MTRSKKIKLFSFAVFVGMLAFTGYQWQKGRDQPDESSLGRVERGSLLQRVTIAGTVIPHRRTLVTAPYNGYVKKIFVQVGDRVKPGDPIVSITQSLQSGEAVFPLRAPFPGTVVQVEKSDGEYVKENDAKEFIARIDDLTKLFILANTPEIDRVKLKVGQEVLIKASAVLGRSYKGVIRELSLAAKEKENWGRSQVEFPLRIEVLDQDAQLQPGMSVVIDIIAKKKDNILTLRHEYVEQRENSNSVTLANGTIREVKLGMQNEEASEILEGLKEGDRVRLVDFSSLVDAK